MRPETRSRFHAELSDLETSVVEMGGLAEVAVRGAVDALVGRDRQGVRAVIAEKREMLLSEISKGLLTTRGNRQKVWTRSRTRFGR